MKKIIITFGLSLILIGGTVFTLSSCGSKKAKTEQKQAIAEVEYKCPMNCEGDKTYDKSGKCPVCGMKLEKVEKK